MLEYALKQERAKFHKLKYGVELQQGDVRPPPDEPPAEPEPAERTQWQQGRQLIKQYLQVHHLLYHLLIIQAFFQGGKTDLTMLIN